MKKAKRLTKWLYGLTDNEKDLIQELMKNDEANIKSRYFDLDGDEYVFELSIRKKIPYNIDFRIKHYNTLTDKELKDYFRRCGKYED